MTPEGRIEESAEGVSAAADRQPMQPSLSVRYLGAGVKGAVAAQARRAWYPAGTVPWRRSPCLRVGGAHTSDCGAGRLPIVC